MTDFIPETDDLRKALIFCFHLKKSAAESHRMLVEAYGDRALSEATCKRWFRRFRDGDFDVRNEERGRPPKKFEDTELQTILDEDPTLSQKQMAEMLNVAQQTISDRLRAMGKIQKSGKWVPNILTDRQMENRKTICDILIQRHDTKSFLHRIVTGNEKWIYIHNLKRKKLKTNTEQMSTVAEMPEQNGTKTMLCVWWDQKGVVYHELLKPGEIVNIERYRQQMIELNNALIEKRPEWATRDVKVIVQHDNIPAFKAKLVQDTIKEFSWELLSHPPYSPDLDPSEYYLFALMGRELAEQHFVSYEEVNKWVTNWFASKDEQFYWRGIDKMPERWKKCVASNGQYFE